MAGPSRNLIDELGYNSSDEDDELIEIASTLFLHPDAELHGGPLAKVPCRTSALSGQEWVNELIHGHTARIMENYRLTVDSFLRLSRLLLAYGFIQQTEQKYVHVEEALAMTLVMLSHNNRQRPLSERFQHSTETINRNIHGILDALCNFGRIIIRPSNRGQNEIHPRIRNDPRFYPWFKNAVGALDGTHISAHAPSREQVAYTNRHGDQSQNVLAVCDFDMRFIYVYAGWEGSAHDVRVLESAVTGPHNFPIPPPGKYYLVDSAYRNIPGFLPPYRGHAASHEDRNQRGRHRARSPIELFNRRHSSLRNVIERCFGVLKKRFSILKGPMANYNMETQIKIVMACCTLHNFIRDEQGGDELFASHDEEMYVEGEYGGPAYPEVQSFNVSESDRWAFEVCRRPIWRRRNGPSRGSKLRSDGAP